MRRSSALHMASAFRAASRETKRWLIVDYCEIDGCRPGVLRRRGRSASLCQKHIPGFRKPI